MREIYKGGVTPQQKMVGVNQKFGNVGIPSQQGTTRILYDTLQNTAGKTNFRFFEDSTARQFPLTNTGSEGNKLGVGDTMVIQQINFMLWASTDFSTQPIEILNSNPTFNLAYLNFEIANNQVIKKLTLSEANQAFNKDTQWSAPISLETNIVIPPLLTFVLELQLPVGLGDDIEYVECQIIGAGGIIAPRTTF